MDKKPTKKEKAVEKEEVDPIDALLNPNDDSNVILFDENGKEVEFEQIAIIPIEDRLFAIMKPTDANSGLKDDEALVFELDETEDESIINLITDDDTIDAVFDEYHKLLKQQSKK